MINLIKPNFGPQKKQRFKLHEHWALLQRVFTKDPGQKASNPFGNGTAALLRREALLDATQYQV